MISINHEAYLAGQRHKLLKYCCGSSCQRPCTLHSHSQNLKCKLIRSFDMIYFLSALLSFPYKVIIGTCVILSDCLDQVDLLMHI